MSRDAVLFAFWRVHADVDPDPRAALWMLRRVASRLLMP